ncbi:hypothetical protein AA0112_g10182 [Alternaria arborescens]|uniref:hypothetical protein n=1 Tax=Alternaria arborescens TaxID=156630 RepID=UPI00107565D4|nr:hypothetical protein AA0111_g11655 [Alternaria arborescens]RYN21506.1 hypothetical protein AA0112_g10182 [Alternaria arborescens]RYO15735.1 hypothetical protein AA0111_g11655 [Alternaria arborescens]
MDPLSIAASIVGITMAALQSAQFLTNLIDSIAEAPATVAGISTDLLAIQATLQSLARALQEGSSQILLSEQVKHAVENCHTACRTFQMQVEHWTKHSTKDKMFWMDRWKLGLFGLERIKIFREQLGNCKSTLSIALSTATTVTMFRQDNVMQEMKDMMLKYHEDILQQQLDRANTETAKTEDVIQQLTTRGGESGPVSQDRESEQSRQEILREFGRQEATHNVLRDMCIEALSQTVYERTGQKIKGVTATNNSSALAGFINASGEELRIDQDISDVAADNWSIAAAGVIKNMDFNAMVSGKPGQSGRDIMREL